MADIPIHDGVIAHNRHNGIRPAGAFYATRAEAVLALRWATAHEAARNLYRVGQL